MRYGGVKAMAGLDVTAPSGFDGTVTPKGFLLVGVRGDCLVYAATALSLLGT